MHPQAKQNKENVHYTFPARERKEPIKEAGKNQHTTETVNPESISKKEPSWEGRPRSMADYLRYS